ncbi:hypothetical protein NLI96_g2246 [Meripilus lineatus]|uniref:Uncharacterized protein n=1 Tax=Meripilus lineatus TaxID=2056292 RepID=A0AAD5YM23_9APHY|nr:hypothetical protein NLI96_g2246 [Physisporinus lineatus]
METLGHLSKTDYTEVLLPTVPSETQRYDDKSEPDVDYTKSLPAGSFLDPEPDEDDSTSLIEFIPYDHPEGNTYLVKEGDLRVVTDVKLGANTDLTRESVTRWTDVVRNAAKNSGVALMPSSELYLRPDGGECCHYYLVDHRLQVIFWVQHIPIGDLSLEVRTSSRKHLRTALKEMYWQHVEQFPSHEVPEICLEVDTLLQLCLFAQADTLTSTTSTLIRTPKEYRRFIEILQAAKGTGMLNSPSIKWFIARQWSQHYRTSFFNRVGEPGCRIDRTQRILETPNVHKTWWFKLLSRILFNVPESYYNRLDAVWSDYMVVENEWKSFLSSSILEWNRSLFASFSVLMVNLVAQQTNCTGLSLTSTALSLLGIPASAALIRYHESFEDRNIGKAADYLSDASNPDTGFQVTAVVHSVPQALALWATMLTCLHVYIWIISQATGIAQPPLTYAVLGSITSVMCLLEVTKAFWSAKQHNSDTNSQKT